MSKKGKKMVNFSKYICNGLLTLTINEGLKRLKFCIVGWKLKMISDILVGDQFLLVFDHTLFTLWQKDLLLLEQT